MLKKRLGIPLLIAIGMLLTAVVVYADMKMVNAVNAWDFEANPNPGFTHALQPMAIDCVTWIPFWYEFSWDNDVYPTPKDQTAYYPAAVDRLELYPQDACPSVPYSTTTGYGDTTPWASTFEYAVYHQDNPPGSGYGFMTTANWELVYCDRDDDGDFDSADLSHTPPRYRNTIIDDPGDIDDGFAVLAQNVITDTECVGNCFTELITTLFVNLDTDCDGDITDEFTGTEPISGTIYHAYLNGGLCFFAEALVPCTNDPLWDGNVQARITRLGGEVTINFHQDLEATPVEISSFTARWYEDRSRLLILGAVAAVLGGAAVGALVWRTRPAQR